MSGEAATRERGAKGESRAAATDAPVLMFYRRPVVLNRQAHARLRVRPARKPFAFAAGVNSVPLVAAEIGDAARSYPVAFVKVGADKLMPLALLGLRQGENLFVDAKGNWDAPYVPAFVRRYPFVLADDMNVCLDEAFEGFGSQEGEALFAEDGANTPTLDNIIGFLAQFHQETLKTQEACARLDELGLLKGWVVQIARPNGRPLTLDGLMVVDQEKLAALPDAQALELFRSGALAWVHAHLHSLANLSQLTARLSKR